MGHDPRVEHSATIVLCGCCCKPFSCAGRGLGFDDANFGDNFDLLAQVHPHPHTHTKACADCKPESLSAAPLAPCLWQP